MIEYLEKKKINALLYTDNINELLENNIYNNYDRNMFYNIIIDYSKQMIINKEMKENIYEIISYERKVNKMNNIILNEIIRITNNSCGYNINFIYLYEFIIRNNYKYKRKTINNFIKTDYNIIKKSIANDYDILYNLIYNYKISNNELFNYTINSLLEEKPELINEQLKNKIINILKESKTISKTSRKILKKLK